jgi:hypothetical protein
MHTLKINQKTKIFAETGSALDSTEIGKIKVSLLNYSYDAGCMLANLYVILINLTLCSCYVIVNRQELVVMTMSQGGKSIPQLSLTARDIPSQTRMNS